MKEQSLWDKLGGASQMESIIDQFVERAVADPAVNYSRDGRFKLDAGAMAYSKRSALEFISSAAGGPLQYTGQSLMEIHKDMAISNREFDAICRVFRQALEAHEVDKDLLEAVMTKVEATRPLIVTVDLGDRATAGN